MTDQREQPGEDPRIETLREQWSKEWGPEIPAWKRRLSALFIVVAFVVVMVAVFLTVS